MTKPDNTPETQELLPVTQVDRDAAADYIGPLAGKRTDERLRSGKSDHVSIVQAFARHRISHSLPGDVGEDEQPGDYLRDGLLNIAAICEAKALHVEAASLRSTATVVSEQLRKWLGRFDETQEMLEHARTALQRIRERFANRGNSSPLWCDMAEDMEAYAAQGLDRSKARG